MESNQEILGRLRQRALETLDGEGRLLLRQVDEAEIVQSFDVLRILLQRHFKQHARLGVAFVIVREDTVGDRDGGFRLLGRYGTGLHGKELHEPQN